MDISGYISELLYDHDCVIIPGFGGFICNYKPAEINAEEHTIAPPGKAVSFNVNLQTNDGLLINHISATRNLSFDIATTVVDAWVVSSNALLASDEELTLKGIGRVYKDMEGNLQFQPDTGVNYLRSSFGLRTVTAVPVVHQKQLDIEERKRRGRRMFRPTAWRMAASVLIVAAIAALVGLMRMGVEVKSLKLDEASVVGFVNEIFKTSDYNLKPVPVEAEQPITDLPEDTLLLPATPEAELVTMEQQPQPVAAKSTPVIAPPAVKEEGAPAYYVIVGAFKDDNNAAAVRAKLLQRFPEQNILFEKKSTLTKVGYYAGNNATIAKEQLDSAHTQDASYWLMKK